MDSMIKIIYALTIYSASLQSSFSVQVMVDSTDIWEARVRATLTSLQNHPCWGLSRGSQCDPSIFNTLDTRKMRLYTAEGRPKIRVVLPDRKQRRLTHHSHRNDSYDAAFVLDPFPDANFGHLVFIFLVDYNVNKTTCNKSMNGVHVSTDRNECIRRAERLHCRNRLSHKQVKCEINFVPLVHDENDLSKKQLLQCRQNLKTLTFTDCGVRESFRLPCSDNSARCLSGSDGGRPKPPEYCTYDQCDHAVLVSGGWNSYTSRPRYRKNLHNVWKLLNSTMRYKKENIVTFFGQGRKKELGMHQRHKSYAVNRATHVKEYIKKLCRPSKCVDTFTLYLTGPSNSDGSLLFWDGDKAGITEEHEMYTPKELLEDVKNCSARRLFIVADYSYSGAMINRLKSRIRRHPEQFRNLVAISSASWGEYAWRSDFTDAFVKHNKEGNTTKCVMDVYEVIKQEFEANGALSTPQIIATNSSAARTTLNGNPCNESWAKAKARDACQLLKIIKWLPHLQLSKN